MLLPPDTDEVPSLWMICSGSIASRPALVLRPASTTLAPAPSSTCCRTSDELGSALVRSPKIPVNAIAISVLHLSELPSDCRLAIRRNPDTKGGGSAEFVQ